MEARGLQVLVVDDDAMMLQLLAPRLREALGADVRTAATPEAALGALPRDGDAFAVVSDYNLKATMNGLQLLAEVARSHPHATRILMSGYSADQIGLHEHDLHAFVEKDLHLDNIVRPILATLQRRHERSFAR